MMNLEIDHLQGFQYRQESTVLYLKIVRKDLMGIILILAVGLYGLMIGEIYILLWFIVRMVGLRKGKTSFTVSWKIPVFYLFYTLVIGYYIFVLSDFRGIFGGDSLPMDEKIFNYTRMIVLVNLSTPLFLWLALQKNAVMMRQSQIAEGKNSESSIKA